MYRRLKILYIFAFSVILSVFMMAACDDETSKIGPSIAPGEVSITIDSITFDLKAVTNESDMFDSRSGNLIIGNLDIPEYGKLSASFVTRLMCASSIDVPDSLLLPERVDSCKFILAVYRGELTGDSLAPQRVSLFKLDKQLPADINNLFDPMGYYDPSKPLGEKSFVISNIANNDSSFIRKSYVSIDIPVDVEFGKDVFQKYKEEPEIFEWPQTLAQYLPGFYVKQTFGKGCVANISEAFMAVYYHEKIEKTVIEDNDTVTRLVNQRDSVIPFIVSPEVLSSNNVSYTVSPELRKRVDEGQTILTTPSGFKTEFKFPAQELLARYENMNKHLSTISDLILSIPAESIDNDMGIANAPNLLMIKTGELESFFAQNKIPDGVSSFTAAYDSSEGAYQFSSLRNYIVGLLNKDEITDDDISFTILPVDISYENVSSSYTGSVVTYVTKCVPYTAKPTVTKLNTESALIVFSFSSQMID